MSEFSISQFNSFKPNFADQKITQNSNQLNKMPAVSGDSKSFVDTLESVIQDTNQALKTADKASEDFAAGRAESLHSVMIAMEKADLSLRTVNAVRNKIVEAYQEIMRMQV